MYNPELTSVSMQARNKKRFNAKIKVASHIVYVEILDSYDENENSISLKKKFLIKDNNDTKCFYM